MRLCVVIAIVLPCLVQTAAAASRAQTPGSLAGGGVLGVPMQVVVLLTLLTLLPAFVAAATPFLRITIVLHFLRQALGSQTVPSNPVMLGLALFLTTLIMQPVANEMIQKGWAPFEKGEISGKAAFEAAAEPLSRFLLKFARPKDIQLFLDLSRTPAPNTPRDLDLKILLPAYVLSELKAGFQIGAVLFLPFLIIDIVVASVTLSIGMIQLPPVMISAPFKIMLFVLVDGWSLLIGSLVKSFYV